jgi:sulfotransferase
MREPRYTIHDGFRMPMGFPAEAFVSGQRYRPTPSDLFIATYPKCGTTWAQYMIYLLLSQGQPLPADRSLNDVFPHLEEVGETVVKALPLPRLVKTHLPFERTPWNPATKYVYVARNPFDCAVSFYHHTRGFVRHYDFADGTWDEFFECFLRGAVDFGDYFDNLLSWWPKRALPNVLFLTYEDMLADTSAAARTIARFVGGAAERAAGDPATLASVVSQSSFDNMRVNQRRWSSERPAEMPEFVRRGIVGDWASLFSAAQARRLAEKFRVRTAGTGAEFLWQEIVTAAAG